MSDDVREARRRAIWAVIKFLSPLIGLAMLVIGVRACRLAFGAPDPCAKEKAAASKNPESPKLIRQLQECRRKQGPQTAPWKRDGGARDENEYVRIPCPPNLPPWRVCEKRRSEIGDAGASVNTPR